MPTFRSWPPGWDRGSILSLRPSFRAEHGSPGVQSEGPRAHTGKEDGRTMNTHPTLPEPRTLAEASEFLSRHTDVKGLSGMNDLRFDPREA